MAYHSNKFGNVQLVTKIATVLYSLDDYQAYSLGAKYTLPGIGTQLAANFHSGKYTMDGGADIKINTVALGVKHPIDNFAVGAQVAHSKFSNFTKGKAPWP
ncbi:MAG: hypothetical protein QM742_10685 [Aquabacterium sp.]